MISRDRRKNLGSPLTPFEVKKLKGILGSLQWLVAQLRFDIAFAVSSLQSETPTIGTMLRANKVVLDCKKDTNCELRFRQVDYRTGGIVSVTDAALGNVTSDGRIDADPGMRVHSQAAYAILLGDPTLVSGKAGRFNLLDYRSHRIARVCRSSYASETLAAEEGLDVAELCRGMLAEALGVKVSLKTAWLEVCKVPLVGVTDAKDTFDRVTQDVGFGAQKSLAFTVASIRQQLKRPNTMMRWTATANNSSMLARS